VKSWWFRRQLRN